MVYGKIISCRLFPQTRIPENQLRAKYSTGEIPGVDCKKFPTISYWILVEEINSKLNFNKKNILILATFLLVLVSIPITAYLLQQTQIFKSRAIEPERSSDMNNDVFTSFSYSEIVKEGKIKPVSDILEVNLVYDEISSPPLAFGEILRKKGYVPPHPSSVGGNYRLEVFNSKNRAIYSTNFVVPNNIYGFPDTATQLGSKPLSLKQLNFTVTIPWFEDISKFVIKDKKQKLVSIGSARIINVNNSPNFQSFFNNNSIPTDFGTQQDNLNRNLEIAAGTYFNITFIGDKYLTPEDLQRFHRDVNRVSNYILTYEPFKSRATQILFHYVDNTKDLGCVYASFNPSLLFCNSAKVIQEVNNDGAIYDSLIVLVNNDQLGGGAAPGSDIAVSYNGAIAPQVSIHEFGHSFGGLYDEYIYDDSVDGAIDGKTYANCYAGVPSSPDWQGLVGTKDYTLGCRYRNWYRSSPTSIMIGAGDSYFNAVAQKFINDRLNYIVGNFDDPTAPISAITNLQNRMKVSGTVPIESTFSDNIGITRGELWVDNSLYQTLYVAPYKFLWETNEIMEGEHVLQVKAYDAAENNGVSENIQVIVDQSVPPLCPKIICDINGDGVEDFKDGDFVKQCWMKNPPLGDCQKVDVTCDGIIDSIDLQSFTAQCPNIFLAPTPTIIPTPTQTSSTLYYRLSDMPFPPDPDFSNNPWKPYVQEPMADSIAFNNVSVGQDLFVFVQFKSINDEVQTFSKAIRYIGPEITP